MSLYKRGTNENHVGCNMIALKKSLFIHLHYMHYLQESNKRKKIPPHPRQNNSKNQ